jgi:hypothetical protein
MLPTRRELCELGVCWIYKPHTLVLFVEEVWFHVSGYVNTQNNRYWSAVNHMVIEVASLNYRMVGVWCALVAATIIQPIFFLDRKHSSICSTHFDTIFEL